MEILVNSKFFILFTYHALLASAHLLEHEPQEQEHHAPLEEPQELEDLPAAESTSPLFQLYLQCSR